MNSLLRGAEKELVDAVNPFSELESAWEKYTEAVSMFEYVQYGIIIVMLIAVFLKYGESEFSRTDGSCISGPVWSYRQERYPENLSTQIHRH